MTSSINYRSRLISEPFSKNTVLQVQLLLARNITDFLIGLTGLEKHLYVFSHPLPQQTETALAVQKPLMTFMTVTLGSWTHTAQSLSRSFWDNSMS